jgi:hypothetical protein
VAPTSVREPDDATLSTAWASWWAFLEARRPWSAHGAAICDRLRRFDESHQPEGVKAVIGQLAQGKYLVLAALRWLTPAVGPLPPAESGPADRARGEQWRLVMAFAGLERLLKTLLRLEGKRGVESEQTRRYLGCLPLPPYAGLPSPPRRAAPAQPGLERGECPKFKGELRTWMDGRAVRSWEGALLLAQTLRHATAHGSLSATRSDRGGLRPALRALVADVGTVAAATFGRLHAE